MPKIVTMATSRTPGRGARWARRIAGVLGTAALLAVGIAMLSMITGLGDESTPVTAPAAAATPAKQPDGKASKQAKKRAKAKAAAQEQARAARAQAVAFLRGRGYVAVREAAYKTRNALRVLVGYRSGDPLGPRRAFFFSGTRFLAYDAPYGSSSIEPAKAGKRWIVLDYGTRKARFELRDGILRTG
jgi:hypothetical protein